MFLLQASPLVNVRTGNVNHLYAFTMIYSACVGDFIFKYKTVLHTLVRYDMMKKFNRFSAKERTVFKGLFLHYEISCVISYY